MPFFRDQLRTHPLRRRLDEPHAQLARKQTLPVTLQPLEQLIRHRSPLLIEMPDDTATLPITTDSAHAPGRTCSP